MQMTQDPAQANLTHQTLHGIFWSYLSFVGGKGLAFVTTVILARLLSPAEFGIMSYCLIAIQYLDILNMGGFDSALISRKDDIDEAANAAFFSSLVMGLIWFAIAWFGSPLVADFFRAGEITWTLRILALCLPIAGLGLVPDAIMQRGLRFRTRLIPDLGRNLAKGLVSIVMAVTGFGVWSLIGGQIASELSGTALSWRLANWKPAWRFKRSVTRAVWMFGLNIILLDLAGAFHNNVDYLLVGRFLGAAALGYYTMAFRIPELIIRSLNMVVGRVSFPVLAQTQADPERMRKFYFGYIRYLALFVYPIGFGLALTAPVSIPFFLSSKWQPAVIPTALISVALAVSAVGYVPGVLYKAIGRPEILNKLAVVKLPCAVLILWIATRWGINGVAAGQIAIAVINILVDSLMANRIMHYSFRDLAQALWPGLSSALLMSVVLWWLWRTYSFDGFPGLALMVVVGAVVCLLGLFLFSRQTVIEGLAILQGLISRKRVETAQMVSHE